MHSRVNVPGMVEVVSDSGGQQDTRVLFVYSISIPHIDLAIISDQILRFFNSTVV